MISTAQTIRCAAERASTALLDGSGGGAVELVLAKLDKALARARNVYRGQDNEPSDLLPEYWWLARRWPSSPEPEGLNL